MRSFTPKLLTIVGGQPQPLEPVAFSGRVDELTLERWIADNPELVGEPLLVLGRQLADFQEDQDRLDVLALDADGEIVLVELKVSENFRVTDLQALAYAGAYATQPTDQLVRTLHRHLMRTAQSAGTSSDEQAPAPPTLGDARQAIIDFLELEDFDAWEPSQRIRIKLIAPRFPARVLKTVKWLGDVYGMPIEAIAVRLFEQAAGNYAISFERVLPLPGEDEFDMTVRQREERRKVENTARNKPCVPLLLESGHLQDGQALWLARNALLQEHRDVWDPDDVAFQAIVRVPQLGGAVKFGWKPEPDAPEQMLSPSSVVFHVFVAKTPWTGEAFSTQVAHHFATEPGGKTLGALAVDAGLWSASS